MQASPFHSSHLVYRAVEDVDEPFLRLLQSDSIAMMNQYANAPQPASTDSVKKARAAMDGSMLAVLICLPTESDVMASGLGSSTDSGSSAQNDNMEGNEKRAIGFVALTADAPIMVHHRTTSLVIHITKPYRGKGYGTEAIEWVLDYAFNLIGLHSVSLGAYEWNEGARKLYQRIGFVQETRKRKTVWFRGRWWDLFEYGMLEEEWRAKRKVDDSRLMLVEN